MFASELLVAALIFTIRRAAVAELMKPGGNVSDMLNAAANRFRHSTVPAGDSIVTSAAASPEHAMPRHVSWVLAAAVMPAVAPDAPETEPVAVFRGPMWL